jgi:ubiquinone/menaquinone biosynthesis C-methylase UbiE
LELPGGREFVAWLGAPPGSAWLDVGCGTGALSQTILELAAPRSVRGIDRSADYLAFAAARIQDPRAQFEQGDAQALPIEDARYDAVVSGLMLNFVPEPARAVAEIVRAARPGGVVAV